ncbi:MAG: PDZ domain-containing protein [Caldimicrobium sp.]
MKKLIFLCIILFTSFVYADEISPEARVHFLKGLQAIEKAKSPKDYLVAEEEFEKVIKYSPNWAEGYYNLALVSETLGKEAKAIKNYKKYLDYISDEKEKKEIEKKIKTLTESKLIKKRIGLSGVNLVSLKDGIYIFNLIDGSKLKQAGFMAGDKIIEVNKRSLVGMSLSEFYELIEKEHENPMLHRRVQAYGENVGIKAPVEITILRGNSRQIIICPLSVFKTPIYEIEEDELEEEVYLSNLPTAVVAWMNWCSFCYKQLPVLEKLVEKYSGKIKFVTINLEINKKFSNEFNVYAAPVTLLFKKDKVVGILKGFKDESTYEDWLNEAINKDVSIKIDKETKTSNSDDSTNCERKIVRVYHVIENSLAWKVGFKPGDIILSIDGKKVVAADRYLLIAIKNLSPGEHKIEVLRGNEKILLTLEIPAQKNLVLGLLLRNECN